MSDPFRTSQNLLPEPHSSFAGHSRKDGVGKRAFAAIAKLWQPRGTTAEPAAATVSRYSMRLIDRVSGQAYSADELRSALVKTINALDGGGNYTLKPEDNGLVLLINPEAAATVEIQADTLPPGFNCAVVRYQSDTVTFSPDGVTLVSKDDLLGISDPYTAASILCTGTNIFLVTGSLA